MMTYFSMPADFKRTTIDNYARLNDAYPGSKIIETYGQITVGESFLSSGRKIDELNSVGLDYLTDYVEYSHSQGIDFSYTMNPTTMGNIELTEKGVEELYKLLKKISRAGVTGITVTMPTVLDIVKYGGFDFKIKMSILSEVDTPNKALHYKKQGVERIVVKGDILREFARLKEMAKVFGEGMEIIVNDTCITDCPYKMFHFNYTAFCSENNPEVVDDYFVNRCHRQKITDLANYMLLNWVRPEDLAYYKKVGICYFKVQGRQFVHKGDPVRVAEAYMKEDFDGDLHDLLNLFVKYNSFSPVIQNKKLEGFIKPFYENSGFCNKNCLSCDYCGQWARKSMDYQAAEPVLKEAQRYFNEYDRLSRLIDNLKQTRPDREPGFDF